MFLPGIWFDKLTTNGDWPVRPEPVEGRTGYFQSSGAKQSPDLRLLRPDSIRVLRNDCVMIFPHKLLGEMATSEKLLEWEALYDRYIGHRANFVALCQYDHSRFGGSAVLWALQTHPLSIIGNIVQENPFYRDPDEVLREMSRSEVSAWP